MTDFILLKGVGLIALPRGLKETEFIKCIIANNFLCNKYSYIFKHCYCGW